MGLVELKGTHKFSWRTTIPVAFAQTPKYPPRFMSGRWVCSMNSWNKEVAARGCAAPAGEDAIPVARAYGFPCLVNMALSLLLMQIITELGH